MPGRRPRRSLGRAGQRGQVLDVVAWQEELSQLIEAYNQPYLYLNRELIREKVLDQGEVEVAVTVTDVNEPPSITSAAAVSVPENQTAVLPRPAQRTHGLATDQPPGKIHEAPERHAQTFFDAPGGDQCQHRRQ